MSGLRRGTVAPIGPEAEFPASFYSRYAPSTAIPTTTKKSRAPSAPVVGRHRLFEQAHLHLKILFELLHLLFVHHELFIGVAEEQPDISRHGAQAQHFAAAVQIARGAKAARAVGRIVIGDFYRQGRIVNYAMIVTI